MECDFTSFSTVFQSYQDDGWMLMKGCVQWNPFRIEAGLEFGTVKISMPALKPMSYRGSFLPLNMAGKCDFFI